MLQSEGAGTANDDLRQIVALFTCETSAHIAKTHVHGFFDTDLHGVSWYFTTHEAVRPSGF